ncbi:MAG: hypothetical protein Kow0020_14250 [Wenzhouxiangellaceae bacterium]
MSRSPARPGRVLAVALAAALAVYPFLADQINLPVARALERPAPPAALPMPHPWGGLALGVLAQVVRGTWRADPGTAERSLSYRLQRYPLEPESWLTLARIRAAAGDGSGAEVFLQRALTVRPNDRETLWNAAQIALSTGNRPFAERQIKRWLGDFPGDTGRALFVVSRWADSPDDLLDRVLPEGIEYLRETLRWARQVDQMALADAAWRRMPAAAGLSEAALLDYVELLIAHQRIDEAAAIWAEHDPAFKGSWPANGDFARELIDRAGGFEWRLTGLPPSVRVRRDPEQWSSAPASLRIEFNGKENVYLAAPSIRMPLAPGRSCLTGRWRAEGLTTRSLPYLALRVGARYQKLPAPGHQFEWQTWSIDVDATDDERLATLIVQRDPTRAFDRNIGGVLWLDDVRLVYGEDGCDTTGPAGARADG